LLTGRPYVEDIMLHADPFHNKYVALVVVVHSTLEDWATKPSI
jgi:long-chain acyl-CoA synthetase